MRNISDLIERYLKDLLIENEHGVIEIGRNELALKFRCVPSQINYVLTTRFSVGQGFCVESKRGGGGYIRIVRLSLRGRSEFLGDLCRQIGNYISQHQAMGIVKRLREEGLISFREAEIMQSVLEDSLRGMLVEEKDRLRASLLRAMLVAVFKNHMN